MFEQFTVHITTFAGTSVLHLNEITDYLVAGSGRIAIEPSKVSKNDVFLEIIDLCANAGVEIKEINLLKQEKINSECHAYKFTCSIK